jgi:hypothetical protein
VAQIDELTPAQKRTLAHVMLLSKVMDNAITIPIIKKKFGLDAMLGLIPYVGELPYKVTQHACTCLQLMGSLVVLCWLEFADYAGADLVRR